MLTLEIRFLTGCYVATRYNDRTQGEWPPHPARLYSALTAALYDDPEHPAEEREALAWLAGAGAPEVVCGAAALRQQPEVYVPVNDTRVLSSIDKHLDAVEVAEAAEAAARASGTKKTQTRAERALEKARDKLRATSVKSAEDDGKAPATQLAAAEALIGRRGRLPRSSPTMVLSDDVVLMRWSEAPPAPLAEALDRVAGRVARLGHSASLVSVRVAPGDAAPRARAARWVPSASGDEVLRVPMADQLEQLDEAHARHQQVQPRVLPAAFVSYANAATLEAAGDDEAPASGFADRGWLVFEVVAPPDDKQQRRLKLSLSLAQLVARAMRGLVIKYSDGGLPPTLSGHAADGRPHAGTHLAFTPLGHVGRYHALGDILGVALIAPRDLGAADRAALLTTIARAEQAARGDGDADPTQASTLRLTLGQRGVLHVRRVRDVSSLETLRSQRWCRPVARWVTVTPIALDKNPGDLRARDPAKAERAIARAEAIIAEACVNIGLPAPTAVWVHRRSLVDGAPEAARFMPFPSHGKGLRRVCVHAEVVFDQPVRGPVMLGAGRFLGLGLCLPKGK